MLIDRDATDRSPLDRMGGVAPVAELAGYPTSLSSGSGRLRLDLMLAGEAVSLSSGFGRLRIDHEIAGESVSVSSAYGKLAIIISISFEFDASVSAGHTVCIDARDFSVLNDGVNAISDFDGVFPDLYSGENTIVYEDSEGSRTVTVAVIKRDRSV